MNKVNEVIERFEQGFNCSQAIVAAYCEELGLDKNIGIKLACPFGAGMGRLGETCGAVSGAYILIGLKYSTYTADKTARNKTYEIVREFTRRFEERNKTVVCRKPTGVDFMSRDNNKAKVMEIRNTVCAKALRDTVEIIEDLLKLK